jgi:hypothetical protein
MAAPLLELEGTWEEIAAHAPEFAGRRLRVIVLPEEENGASAEEGSPSIEEKIERLMADVPEEEWAKLPPDLTDNPDHYIYGTPKRK